MKNNAVVIRIDKDGIDQAKQIYSCLYLSAGWKGDFVILSHQIPQRKLIWFKKQGVYIKPVKPLFGVCGWSIVTTSKLYIFSIYFKKWKQVIFLDTDIIINASINKLTYIKGFAAAVDIEDQPLHHQLILESKKDLSTLKNVEKLFHNKFNVFEKSFNTGVIAFNTNIIKKDTFSNLVSSLRIAAPICRFSEQSILNLYFYNKWEKLPRVYNLVPRIYINRFKINKNRLAAIIFHFAGSNDPKYKPWNTKNQFYHDWNKNLQLANSVELSSQIKIKVWSHLSIYTYEIYYKIRRLLYTERDQILHELQDLYRYEIIKLRRIFQ